MKSSDFQVPWPDASCAGWVMPQCAPLAADADGEEVKSRQTTRVCLKTFFPDTRNYNLSWFP